MELIDYVRMLGRRWAWVVGFALAGLAAGLAWHLTTARTYTTTADLFVGSVSSGAPSSTTVSASSSFVLSRMPSYAQLVDSPGVTQGVIDQLNLAMTPGQVAGKLSASVPSKTVLLRITATDSQPARAADIANAAATRLGSAIEELESSANGGRSPVNITVTRPATAPGSPASPNRVLDVGLGLIVGLGLGLLAAAIRDQAARRPVAPQSTDLRSHNPLQSHAHAVTAEDGTVAPGEDRTSTVRSDAPASQSAGKAVDSLSR